MRRIIISAFLGGAILFIWSAISWMVLPWHTQTMHSFKDEKSIIETVSTNAATSGIYFLPQQEPAATQAKTPIIFAAISQEGMTSMTPALIKSLLSQILAAGLAAWLLSTTVGLNYSRRVLFLVTISFIAWLVVEFPYWNWFKFPIAFVAVSLADLLISWFLAGLVMAKIVKSS